MFCLRTNLHNTYNKKNTVKKCSVPFMSNSKFETNFMQKIEKLQDFVVALVQGELQKSAGMSTLGFQSCLKDNITKAK